MKLWGVVIEVNQKDIIVSLPGGMRGFVRTEEVSDIALHGNSKVLIFLVSFCFQGFCNLYFATNNENLVVFSKLLSRKCN